MRARRDDMLASVLLGEMFDSFADDRTHPTTTDLIYCLTKGYWNSTQKKLAPPDKNKMFMLLGLGLEKALLEQRQANTRTYELDGIPCHVDSMTEEGLLELKSTRMSPNRFPDNIPDGWLKQMLAYSKMTGETIVSLSIIHIIQAELAVWELEFEPEEIEANWRWLLERKASWQHFADRGEAPTPFMFNEPWECKDCVYKLVCDSTVYMKMLGEQQ